MLVLLYRIKEVEAKMAIVDKFKEELAKKHEAKDREASEAKVCNIYSSLKD